jgi:hypothetical protein
LGLLLLDGLVLVVHSVLELLQLLLHGLEKDQWVWLIFCHWFRGCLEWGCWDRAPWTGCKVSSEFKVAQLSGEPMLSGSWVFFFVTVAADVGVVLKGQVGIF